MNKQLIRKILRKKFRNLRKKQTLQQQCMAEQKIIKYIINDPYIKKIKKIALFISFDGEIQTRLLIKKLLQKNKEIYLPIIQYSKISKYLIFSKYTYSTPLLINKFHIQEPEWDINTLIPVEEIDILFIPLVAFDKCGNRLGTGGGFYDRILAHWFHKQKFLPIGLAYDCQLSKKNIPIEPWDVSLPEIITPSRHWIW
ncbi:5-formyltetrahydrofolate cyclo-ligase [Blochmannia endosymbiont of Colobopsis nipponica]|uniref:5-formyltetrahydrofolate cyclo-ligase n=1 Tax=Blochmannia endosymbiont of Colobopsis nipponica TaxID=2681987 RepID=UPI001CE2B066|nr:5-formyltetrahydrofolate cyclo-ligase [Blochmannia endosymbiont of Colobopsis nipponica]